MSATASIDTAAPPAPITLNEDVARPNLLVVTHDVEEARLMARRVIVFSEPSARIRADPPCPRGCDQPDLLRPGRAALGLPGLGAAWLPIPPRDPAVPGRARALSVLSLAMPAVTVQVFAPPRRRQMLSAAAPWARPASHSPGSSTASPRAVSATTIAPGAIQPARPSAASAAGISALP